MLPIYIEGSPEFDSTLSALRTRGTGDLANVTPAVTEIIDNVRRGGTSAVLRYIETFERRTSKALVRHAGPEAEGGFGGAEALARLPPDVRAALETAAARIARYHERQRDAGDLGPADAAANGPPLQAGFSYEEEGVLLGMRVRPLRRVGVYAPGGKARYPSSVLMSAIPARIAGVREIVLASPSADDATLAAAHLSGVTTLLDSGGAQAIAAMAYGLPELASVDKIVGPGNAYVACAKRLVFGDVSIDGITGPSEILALADDTADPRLVAADLLSQAEHDEASYALLATTSAQLAEAVARELDAALPELTRRTIVQASLSTHAAALVVGSRARLAEVADQLGVEHVAFHVTDPEGLFSEIGTLGAALLGSLTPVAAGDYLAGPSHVLPTGGSARFGSPLGVYDFVMRASLIRYSSAALQAQGPTIEKLAQTEGLQAHARAVSLRLAIAAEGPAAKRGAPQS